MPRYKLTLEYCGTNYHGMQKQPHTSNTIQSTLERAISLFYNTNIAIEYCGRTDAGVHAAGQVIHFDAVERDLYKIKSGINAHLRTMKAEIAINEVKAVDPEFHSRFDAKKRTYIYKIINRAEQLTFQSKTHLLVTPELNIAAIQSGLNYLIGRHDFSSFRSAQCQAPNAIKTIDEILVTTLENCCKSSEIWLIFKAKSFLHHMVRNIVGTVIKIGTERQKPEWMQEVMDAKHRPAAGETAPPQGLYFWHVDY